MEELRAVSENPNSTVVANYEFDRSKATSYQSETELEKEFIKNITRTIL